MDGEFRCREVGKIDKNGGRDVRLRESVWTSVGAHGNCQRHVFWVQNKRNLKIGVTGSENNNQIIL